MARVFELDRFVCGFSQGAIEEFARGYLDETVAHCHACVLTLYANVDAVPLGLVWAGEDYGIGWLGGVVWCDGQLA